MVQGFVYKILCKKTGKYYIGSTMNQDGLKKRKSQHRNDYLRFWNGTLNYRSYFDVMIEDDYEYEILQEIDNCCKDDLFDAECIAINNSISFKNGCVNKNKMLKRWNNLQEECGWII